jgi:acetyl-CoA carboxylase carboxyl transferase subunit beta
MERRRTATARRTPEAPAVETAPRADQVPPRADPAKPTEPKPPRAKRGVPEGLWLKCDGCGATIYRKDAEDLQNVCPQCGFHWYVSAVGRIGQLLDTGTFEEWDSNLRPTDPLGFKDKKPYADRIVLEQKRTGLSDAVITGTGMIRARRVAIGVTDSAFIMGSMGSVVGERLARLVEKATVGKLPLIIISASGGGARMHEGILSLMQMAKTAAAIRRLHESRMPPGSSCRCRWPCSSTPVRSGSWWWPISWGACTTWPSTLPARSRSCWRRSSQASPSAPCQAGRRSWWRPC